MKKAQITALAQELVGIIAENISEKTNLRYWSEVYLQDIEIYTGHSHVCQWCEKHSAAVTLDQQLPDTTPDKICKRCLVENLFDFLDNMRDVTQP
jgi:hypothetical protein